MSSAFKSYPDEYRNPAHGIFVSGIIEYGDELNGSSYSALPGVKLFDEDSQEEMDRQTGTETWAVIWERPGRLDVRGIVISRH